MAIALASFLMSAVLFLSSGIITVNMNGGNSITGSYHALVSGITQEQYHKLHTDSRINLLGFNAPVGSIKVDDKRLNVSYSNKECLTLNGLSLSAGQMPVQKNEILIEEEYLLSQKINAGIGDAISLPISGSQEKMDFVISGYLETSAKGSPVVVILVNFTVILSIRKPAMIAATVSPIEASRYENGVIIHSHKHQKLTPHALARGQISRYKKKDLIIIASFVLTGILLLGLSSVLSSVNARDMSLSGFERGQFFVELLEQAQNNSPFTDEIYSALSHLSGIEEITVYQYLPVSNELQSRESDAAIVGFSQEDIRLIQSCTFN